MSNQNHDSRDDLAQLTKPHPTPKWTCIAHILQHSTLGALRSYLISFGLRGGVTCGIQLFRVLRQKYIHDLFKLNFILDNLSNLLF